MRYLLVSIAFVLSGCSGAWGRLSAEEQAPWTSCWSRLPPADQERANEWATLPRSDRENWLSSRGCRPALQTVQSAQSDTFDPQIAAILFENNSVPPEGLVRETYDEFRGERRVHWFAAIPANEGADRAAVLVRFATTASLGTVIVSLERGLGRWENCFSVDAMANGEPVLLPPIDRSSLPPFTRSVSPRLTVPLTTIQTFAAGRDPRLRACGQIASLTQGQQETLQEFARRAALPPRQP